MNTIDDGGPAFPHSVRSFELSQSKTASFDGMSLRDWFASMALNEQEIELLRLQYEAAHPHLELYSFQSLRYFHADAMLAARQIARTEGGEKL